MSSRVTIQDIADALHLSRNTVSKVLNSPESVPEATRRRVLEMATAMNYKSIQQITESKQEKPLKILLISLENKLSSSFFTQLYQKLHEQAKQYNMAITIQLISTDDIRTRHFPDYIHVADGILIMEVLNVDYIQTLLKLEKPTVFFDFAVNVENISKNYDIVMEQNTAVYQLTERLILQGRTRIGFYGDVNHCLGFQERFYSFRNAMLDHKLPLDNNILLTNDTPQTLSDSDYVLSLLRRLKLPQAFVCANDYVAFTLMEALKKMHIRIPEDIAVCGFDNVPDFWLHTPYLTTVDCSKDMLALNMLWLLASRIRNPNLDIRVLHVGGKTLIRESLI